MSVPLTPDQFLKNARGVLNWDEATNESSIPILVVTAASLASSMATAGFLQEIRDILLRMDARDAKFEKRMDQQRAQKRSNPLTDPSFG